MDVRTERKRLLEAEDEDENLSGLLLEQDAYLRLVHTPDIASETSFTGVALYRSKQTNLYC